MKIFEIAAATLILALGLVAVRAAEFPTPYNSEPDQSTSALPPNEAVKLTLPAGFQATVFAAEPDVQNPIALAWDARGRLWVAENYTYAERPHRFDLKLRDRLVIFSDRDGDGRFDERKVFADDLQMLTSVEVGLGGVWVMCPPQVLFIPDADGDDRPDGPAECVVDGFTVPPENFHNFANGLRFGPDGWLYGRCGASSPGDIGTPGTPAAERIPLRGGMWRYHPARHTVEALAGGTTNPWGHDWDERGELFFINTVNGHLWHNTAGAHYTRPHTIDPNPHVYELIDFHADHWHYDTKTTWDKSRDGAADSYGGGHAHIGCMIYQGDNWPDQYRGRLFTLNMHGRRANQERLDRDGSGYVGRHEPDFFLSPDRWFRGMELSCGPDGGVYVLDWSDTGECHENTGVHRTSGRIFKITCGEPKQPEIVNVSKLSSQDLVDLHARKNAWFVQQARLELMRRAMTGMDLADANAMKDLETRAARPDTDEIQAVRYLLTAYCMAGSQATRAANSTYASLLKSPHEAVRIWGVRLLTDHWPLDTVLSQRPARPEADVVIRGDRSTKNGGNVLAALVEAARNDKSPGVRLALASALQRLPVNHRLTLATPLVKHASDAGDHNLPLMIWYGLIPVAEFDPAGLAKLAAECELPTTRRLIARRLAEGVDKNPAPLNELLVAVAARGSLELSNDVIQGLAAGFKGWRKAPQPQAWPALASSLVTTDDAALKETVRELSVLFGDGRALDEVRAVALDKTAELSVRKAALQTLIDNRPNDLREVCEQLLSTRFLNSVAARGLATYDDPVVAAKLVAAFKQVHHSERGQLLAVLVSRPTFARALLTAVAEEKIPRAEISASHARQMHSMGDSAVDELLTKTWGEFRDSPAEKKAQATQLKQQLKPDWLAQANHSQGRATFARLCANCHKLYGEGQTVGPDLTGANRDNLDYLVDNIVDPSAVVSADFRMSILAMKDGRTLNGLVLAKTDRTLTLRTATESLTIERAEVEEMHTAPLSLMPENQLQPLTPEQQRDLFGYLMHRGQVPLP